MNTQAINKPTLREHSTIKAFVPFRREICTILGHETDQLGNVGYYVKYSNLPFQEVLSEKEVNLFTLIGTSDFPLSTQLATLTGDSYNMVDFEERKSVVKGLYYLTHKASGKAFRCMADSLEQAIYNAFPSDYRLVIDGVKYVMVWENGTCLKPVRELEEVQIIEYVNKHHLTAFLAA
jgi:hypothetical protein